MRVKRVSLVYYLTKYLKKHPQKVHKVMNLKASYIGMKALLKREKTEEGKKKIQEHLDKITAEIEKLVGLR